MPEPRFTHAEILRILSGILLSMLLASLDQTVLATALPAIAADFNSVQHLSWAITAYLLTATAATMIFGKLSDLFGRRVLLEMAIGIFLLGSVLSALAPSMGALIASRALQGAGGGGIQCMTQAAIADIVSARERGRYQAYITGTFGAAALAGPLIGGLSVQYLTWRWVFWINLPIGITAYFLADRGLRRVPVVRVKRPIDYPGVLLMLPGVTLAMLALSWGGSEMPWLSPRLLGVAAAGAAFLAAFAWRERRAADALLPPRLFASPVMRAGFALNTLMNMTMTSTYVLLPVFFQIVVGVTPGWSGAMLLPPLTLQIVVSILTGRQLNRRGRYAPLIRAGFASLFTAECLFASMTARTPIWHIELFMMFYAAAIGLCQAPLWVVVQNAAEFRDLGAVTGANGFCRAIGSATGVAFLWSVLLFALNRTVAAEGHPSDGSALLRGGRAALEALPADVRGVIIPALAHAYTYPFAVAAAIAAAGFAASWVLREIPLRTTTAKPAPAE